MKRNSISAAGGLLAAALLAASGTVLAQDATDDDPSTDLWLLGSQTAVSRIDGESGELLSQLGVTEPDCTWDRLAGPADGAIWLMDSSGRGERSRLCVARFPLDGTEPQVFWLRLGKGVWADIHQAVVLDDALWMVASMASDPVLYRLDLSAGVEQASLDPMLPRIGAVGLLGDDLVVGQLPKKGRTAWKPARYTPDGGKPIPLDIGLSKNEAFDGVITNGEERVAFLGTKPVVYDPASGEVSRPKMPKRWDAQASAAVAADGLWASRPDARPGCGTIDCPWLYMVPTGSTATINVMECAVPFYDMGGSCPAVVGTTPGAVWVLLDAGQTAADTNQIGTALLRRYDVATHEATVEVDASAFIASDMLDVAAEATSGHPVQ